MTRVDRMQSVAAWVESRQTGDIIRQYARHCGVELRYAMVELRMFGVDLSPKEVASVVRAIKKRLRRRLAAARIYGELDSSFPESDDHHAYIAGYTSGGAAYGITWEQAEEMRERES